MIDGCHPQAVYTFAMSVGRRVAWLILALSTGCAGLPKCPGEGGPRWTEWTSPHFRVLTDQEDDRDAERLVSQLEYFREAIVTAAWREVPDVKRPIEVVAFRSVGEADVFLPPDSAGAFVSYLGTGTVVAPVTERVERAKILKHELVHALTRQMGLDRNAPIWFVEGVAMYLATTTYDETSDEVTFGAVDREALGLVAHFGRYPWPAMWSWPTKPTEQAVHEATSWLFVHYLFNHQADRFHRFQTDLAADPNARGTWAKIFPDLVDFKAVDQVLDTYLGGGEYSRYKQTIPRPRFGLASRPIPDDEVHAVRALLFTWVVGHDESAPTRQRAELAEALRINPLNLRARLVERFILKENIGDVEIPLALTKSSPLDWRSWVLLASAHESRKDGPAFQAALQLAVAMGFQGSDANAMKTQVASPH